MDEPDTVLVMPTLKISAYVALPAGMDAVSLQVLGQELVAAALLKEPDSAAKKPKKGAKETQRRPLPGHINEALDDVAEQVEQLTGVMSQAPGKPPAIRPLDKRMDRVIRAFEGICEHWALLAGELPQGDAAAAVHERVFSEGLEWITKAPRKQWGVMDAKLKTIEDDKLAPKLAEIGALPVLELARRLHAEYGQAVGITAPLQDAEYPQVRERMDELAEAIRTYAVRVVGLYQRNKPETAALVEELLKPIDDLRRTRRRKAKDDEGGGAAE